MPNYNLRCEDCGEESIIRATMTEKAEGRLACPGCGSAQLATVFKVAPAVVKGMKEVACPNQSKCGSHCRSA